MPKGIPVGAKAASVTLGLALLNPCPASSAMRERPAPAVFDAKLLSSDIVYSERAMQGAPVVFLAEPRRHAAGVSVPAGVARIYGQSGNSAGNDNSHHRGGDDRSRDNPGHDEGEKVGHWDGEHGDDDDGGRHGERDGDHNGDGHRDNGRGPGDDERGRGQDRLITELVKNGDFSDGLEHWDSRSAYVTDKFGPIVGPGGKFAVAHTGYFWFNDEGHIEQGITVPMARSAALSMAYNFVTTEFPVWVGSQYNDYFQVTLSGPSGEKTFSMAEFLNNTQFEGVSGLPEGVLDGWPPGSTPVTGGQTGWKSFAQGGLPLKNGIYKLKIEVHDVTDQIVDSAILVDNISLK